MPAKRGGRARSQPTRDRDGAIEIGSAGGRVAARIEPRAGCAIVSLRIDGREWLHLPEPLPAFLRHDRTGGVPLLFPWANRLRDDRYEVLRRSVDLRRQSDVHRDGSGRPMHGVLLRWPKWRHTTIGAGADAPNPEDARSDCMRAMPSRFSAELDWREHPSLMRAFPFDAALRIAVRVFDSRPLETGQAPAFGSGGAAGLEVTTEVEARSTPVPLSFGWHPYVKLPAPRARCRLHAPPLWRIPLVEGLPRTPNGAPSGVAKRISAPSRRAGRGETMPHAPEAPSSRLPRGGLDDLFAGVRDGMAIAVEEPGKVLTRSKSRSAPTRVAVEFVRGYRFTQLFSPPGADFICVEPMVAPTAALSDRSAELPILGPGGRFSSCFRVVVAGGSST